VSPRVLLEPIGETIDCGAEETVLAAAFRHGLNLFHGCREGQCSACKAYLLEGEVALAPYSTFALSEWEESSGYTLLCRAMPEEDLVVELLHHDPDLLRLESPIREGTATVRSVEPLGPDLCRLVLALDEPAEFAFAPGQYVDLVVPGSDARRSFSLANLPGEGALELILRRYPGGRFSGLVGDTVVPGTPLRFSGPYGSVRLRDGGAPVLLVAGGAGIAPILALLRQLAVERTDRPVRLFHGVRTRGDLLDREVVEAPGSRLGDFRFEPVVSEPLTDAVDRGLAAEPLAAPDVYVCGPPPMVEAVTDLLTLRHGVDARRIFHDKFTASADAGVAHGT
jgi:propane monooxygenase reductase subunit